MVFDVVVVATLFTIAFVAWWTLRWLLVMLGVLLGLRFHYGVAKSYREQIAKGAALDYYEMQNVIYFLKAQEKVLTNALVNSLRERGIDTSDLRENIAAFINQGVINTGQIRGNVATKIRSMVFRRSNTAKRGLASNVR